MVEQHVPILLLLVVCSVQVHIQGELELLMSVIESFGVALPSLFKIIKSPLPDIIHLSKELG